MKKLLPLLSIATLFAPLVALVAPAQALPGQSTEEVEAWMQGHDTLQPRPGERLMVRKHSSAAQRFSFQSSIFSPGLVSAAPDRGKIRTETLTFFDIPNGVSVERLEESLRVIYGLDIYQDFNNAQVTYKYPGSFDVAQAQNRRTPLQAARTGEVRYGDRFGYWYEIAQPQTGKAIAGQIIVFLKEDIDKVERELRNR